MTSTLTIPALTVAVGMLPPTVNHQYITRAGGGKALTREAATFRRLVGSLCRTAVREAGWSYPEGARLELEIRLTFPNRKNQDIDNRVKAALDALALALGFNDSCVDRIVVERVGVVRNRPLCEMVLRVME
jgi:Holliday junction resolvase RusA-like endonuclease